MESVKPGAFQSHGIGGASAAPARPSFLPAFRSSTNAGPAVPGHQPRQHRKPRGQKLGAVFNPLPVTVKDVKLDADEEARRNRAWPISSSATRSCA